MNEFVSYPFIRTNILVTQQSVRDNPYTWDNTGVGLTELELVNKFVSYIKDEFTILDIGAQSGCFSLAARYYPNTIWHSFEPDPSNYSLLLDNLKLNNIHNVNTYETALSDKVGEATLKICDFHKGLNTLGENLIRFSPENSINCIVETNTIDNLFLSKKIDLIKIDTEGSEYDIIKGGIQTIEKYKPKILLEYYQDNLNQFGKKTNDIDELLEEINYKISWVFAENIFIEPRTR
jgi:FkbM family methyltransferase